MADRHSDNLRRLAVFPILFVFWLIFSGYFDALHVGLGIVCTTLVAYFSADLLLLDVAFLKKLLVAWRFLQYVPWLLYQIVLANLHVVYLIFRPSELHPQIVRFHSRLSTDLSKVTLGNSITLTPGTVTMDIDGEEFCVHALSDKAARGLVAAEMERRVAHIFLEPEPASTPPVTPER